ncbi:putative F-box protein At3g52320 [Silene latifolia]|uniref:putative F-box protein At3g52320 n=1 Tax=Silene latifolia TaxID=37657 RepID=UPI003D783703
MEMNDEKKIKGEVSRRKCNTSDASFADIPLEIQIDILSRLRPNLLSTCECVSKYWNDTLTTRAFLLKHSRSYDKHSKLAFVVRSIIWGKETVISFELNDDNTPKTEETKTVLKPNTTASYLITGRDEYFTDFYPVSCCFYMSNICNELFCLFNPSSTRVGLLNIRTRDFIRLPSVTIKSVDGFRFWYALGFDPVHKVLKVLSIYGSRTKDGTTKAAILTVGSKYWNPIDNETLPSSLVEQLPSWNTTNSHYLDGVIYFVHRTRISYKVLVLTVFAFDLNSEVFRDNELVTRHLENKRFRHYLTSLKECPTLFIWKINDDWTEEVEEYWILFDHKNPNSAWKRRNSTNHNCSLKLPYDFYWPANTGGTTLMREYSERTNSKFSSYLLYDLENYFAIE